MNGIDLVVSFDTTGSMYPVLSQVRNKVQEFVREMQENVKDIRIGIIAHGDYCDKDDPYTIRILDLTTDIDKICDFIRTTKQTYGGDADECYELVLNNARTSMSWGEGRTKILVLIGDASPHGVNYPDNRDKLDWNNEAGLLNDTGVKIFAVHALSYYRSRSKNFYDTIARKTGGKYLTLDQFDEVVELITATCISEYSEEKLNDYVSIIKKRGPFTHTMERNIGRLRGEVVSEVVKIKDYGTEGMIPVAPGRFQTMHVDENCDIKSFVTNNGIEFKRGRGFYELTKHETVQQYKEVIIQDRTTGDMFTGQHVRKHLGLLPQCDKGGAKESLSSRDISEFRIFVQSTSVNRKLIGGTTFLYEISDIHDTGTVIKPFTETTASEDKEEKVEKTTKKTKSDREAKKEAVKEEKAAKKEAVRVEKKERKIRKSTKKADEHKPNVESITSEIFDTPSSTTVDTKEPEVKLPSITGCRTYKNPTVQIPAELFEKMLELTSLTLNEIINQGVSKISDIALFNEAIDRVEQIRRKL